MAMAERSRPALFLAVLLWQLSLNCPVTQGQGALKCETGFRVDTTGKTTQSCVDVDECKTNLAASCHVLAYCRNTEGSFECVCQPGMYGDGHDCRSTAYAVRTVLAVNSTLSKFEQRWAAVKGLYGDLLTWGGVPVMERIMIDQRSDGPKMSGPEAQMNARKHLVDTTHKTAEFDPVFNTTTVTMHALFQDKDAAEAARFKVIGYTLFGYYSFESLFSRISSLPVSVIDPPKVHPWQAGTSADPHRINPAGFKVEEVYFVHTCMQGQGCWVVDVTYATGKRNTISVMYLSRVTDQDQPRLSRETKDTFKQNNFPCSTDVDPTRTTRRGTVCCLSDFVQKYRTVEAFELWVQHNTSLATVCAEADGFKSAPKSSILTGLPDFATGRFANMTFSKVIDRGVFGMHGDFRAARILLHEGELKAMVGTMSDGIGQKSKADCFVGIAHLTPTGARFLDSVGQQKRLSLDRFDKNSFIAIDNSQRMQIDSKPWFSVDGSSSSDGDHPDASAAGDATDGSVDGASGHDKNEL